MPITPELLDELLKEYKSPDDMFGHDGLLQQLTKAVVERALQGELTHHLGYAKHSPEGHNSGNSRNGKSKKTIRGKRGQLEIDVPFSRPTSWMVRIFGWLSEEAAKASCSKRRRRSWFCVRSAGSTFSAMGRRKVVSWAR